MWCLQLVELVIDLWEKVQKSIYLLIKNTAQYELFVYKYQNIFQLYIKNKSNIYFFNWIKISMTFLFSYIIMSK